MGGLRPSSPSTVPHGGRKVGMCGYNSKQRKREAIKREREKIEGSRGIPAPVTKVSPVRVCCPSVVESGGDGQEMRRRQSRGERERRAEREGGSSRHWRLGSSGYH
ncbi:hypothetical protein Sjap_014808 [Stephania japonica]|uniref:Uncharacterized protein n=1 Tax=Stephania japonica TaxID=461633 RepID=A0AAP0IJG6_9MAGN